MKKVKFDVDWSDLFPGKSFDVGSKTHFVKPLNIKGIAMVVNKVKSITPILKEQGIDLNKMTQQMSAQDVIDMMLNAVPILMENVPEVISEATGIEVESLMDFPPQYLIKLVTVAIETNMESKEALEKNFKSLTKIFKMGKSQKK
jgi:hypothetical protein